MTIEKAKVTPNVPANYEEELAAERLAIARRIGSPSGDVIRVQKDKTFEFPSGESAPEINGVVVGFVSMNQYYDGKFDPREIKPPVCMALGQEIALMQPFDRSPKKQNADCFTCWANQWGSDGKGKACKNQRLVAIVAADDQTDGPIMLFKVSPTGTRFWDSYVTKAVSIADALIKVVTRVTFDQNVDYASLRFSILRPNPDWKGAFGRRAAALERLLMEPEFAPAEVAPKPAAKK